MTTTVTPEQHGTSTGYRKGCRCDDCRRANTRRTNQHRLRKVRPAPGPHDRLDPATSIAAIHRLHSLGYNNVAIGKLAGVAHAIVWKITGKPVQWIERDTQDRLLAALRAAERRAAPPPQQYLPVTRVRQQMYSLAALGWSLQWQARELGYRSTRLPFQRDRVTADSARKVQELYDRLSGTRGPSKRAATFARKAGWYVPLAYDDDGQLLPDAIRQPHADPAPRTQRRQTRLQAVAALTAKDLSASDIADRLGVDKRQVVRDRQTLRSAS